MFIMSLAHKCCGCCGCCGSYGSAVSCCCCCLYFHTPLPTFPTPHRCCTCASLLPHILYVIFLLLFFLVFVLFCCCCCYSVCCCSLRAHSDAHKHAAHTPWWGTVSQTHRHIYKRVNTNVHIMLRHIMRAAIAWQKGCPCGGIDRWRGRCLPSRPCAMS